MNSKFKELLVDVFKNLAEGNKDSASAKFGEYANLKAAHMLEGVDSGDDTSVDPTFDELEESFLEDYAGDRDIGDAQRAYKAADNDDDKVAIKLKHYQKLDAENEAKGKATDYADRFQKSLKK